MMKVWLTSVAAIGLAASVSCLSAEEKPARDPKALVGTWRIISHPSGEGDHQGRYTRKPGVMPKDDEPLVGWPLAVFTADGQCGILLPAHKSQYEKYGTHRRVTWPHDEDSIAEWKIVDPTEKTWRIDMRSAAEPQSRPVIDPVTKKRTGKSEWIVDPATGKVAVKTWTYPGIVRVDGDYLTLLWYQNHRKTNDPQELEKHRPPEFWGFPHSILEGMKAGRLLGHVHRPKEENVVPNRMVGPTWGIIAKKVSDKALDLPPPPPLPEPSSSP
ncbi:MAG: hypothetical protein JNM56_21365 [Planctomycetia bacterium]|nr:hypothetical protein [Planctomycetia bacterium]